MNLFIKTEIDSQTQKPNQVTKGERRDKLGAWDLHICITIYKVYILHIYKVNNQQGPTVQHRELYSVFNNNLCGKKKLKEWIYVYA